MKTNKAPSSSGSFLAHDLFICDAHADTLSKMLKFGWTDLEDIPANSHVTIPRLRESAHGLVVFACFTEKNGRESPPVLRTLRMLELAHSIVAKHADWMSLVTDTARLERARRSGKLAMVLSIENGIAVEDDINLLRTYHRLGVRMMSIAWNHRNRLGGGAGSPKARRGLTPFGRDVVLEMERLGMMVDVSHLNERTFWDVVETAKGPVVASHSNAFSVRNHPRNLKDDQIRAIAKTGGFIGLNFCGYFLKQSAPVTAGDIIRHARHIAEVGGIEVLAIGSDYDGISDPPAGMRHIGRSRALLAAFEKAGFSRAEIKQLAHQNFLRVFRAVCG